MRLDQYLVEIQIYPTRNRAQEAIKQGLISVNGKIVRKGSVDVSTKDHIENGEIGYVSRSGTKLAEALAHHPFAIDGKTVLDLGASTGVFTQVALQQGARHVFAVDVGTLQLEESLRRDPRVVSMENTDARNLHASSFDRHIDLLLMDVSFISGRKILASILPVLKPPFYAFVLIKPQFEVGLAYIGANGIVKNPRAIETMLDEYRFFLRSYGVRIHDIFPCGFKGKEGNTEYFVVFEKTQDV
ncbi:MAG: TlyA family RNA methyltransferase [Erysipelotrichales bacterium]|nr:MAG: TlyA family RNA methyltransferase [Erysipelotrichales bacterium]